MWTILSSINDRWLELKRADMWKIYRDLRNDVGNEERWPIALFWFTIHRFDPWKSQSWRHRIVRCRSNILCCARFKEAIQRLLGDSMKMKIFSMSHHVRKIGDMCSGYVCRSVKRYWRAIFNFSPSRRYYYGRDQARINIAKCEMIWKW